MTLALEIIGAIALAWWLLMVAVVALCLMHGYAHRLIRWVGRLFTP
jgi:hypothetical protein